MIIWPGDGTQDISKSKADEDGQYHPQDKLTSLKGPKSLQVLARLFSLIDGSLVGIIFLWKAIGFRGQFCVIFRGYPLFKIELPQGPEIREHTQVGKHQFGLPQSLKLQTDSCGHRREGPHGLRSAGGRKLAWTTRKCAKRHPCTLSGQKQSSSTEN